MLRIQIAEKRRALVRREQVNELLDDIAGVTLTALSSLAARCSPDLAVRRRIDQVVFQVRREKPEACTAMADERGEPPLEQQV